MTVPSYWLPRPEMDWSSETESELEEFYVCEIVTGVEAWLDEALPVSKWAFLCWLVDKKQLLLHGSGDSDIAEFEPRKPHDDSPDTFSKQTAVFAASDGIWPIFYAILDRAHYRPRMLNGALQFELSLGELTDMRYFFSITQEVLEQHPWREGTVYILPRIGFEQQPPYELGSWRVHEPHWARLSPVSPLAKLRVTAEDFPLLQEIRGHDDAEVMARAASDPYGFPWLEN